MTSLTRYDHICLWIYLVNAITQVPQGCVYIPTMGEDQCAMACWVSFTVIATGSMTLGDVIDIEFTSWDIKFFNF